MKDRNIWIYGFNWGSIIGAGILIFKLIGYYIELEQSFIWNMLTSLIFIFGFSWIITNYKRNIIKENLKFSRLFLLGFIASLLVSLFHVFYMTIYMSRLEPSYFNDFLILYQDILNEMGSGLVLSDEIIYLIEKMLLPLFYIANLIGNLFYVLLISILISMQRMLPNIPSENNDYSPYNSFPPEENNEEQQEQQDNEEQEEQQDNKN